MAEIDYPTKPNTITTTPLKLLGFNIQNVSEENDSDSSKSSSGSTLLIISEQQFLFCFVKNQVLESMLVINSNFKGY
jgi:hypothetical protein